MIFDNTSKLHPPLKLAIYPRTDANPYVDLFCRAMGIHGVEVEGTVEFTEQWLRERASSFDAIHLHWSLQRIWQDYRPTFRGSWRVRKIVQRFKRTVGRSQRGDIPWLSAHLGTRMLERFLKRLRQLGVRVIWTLHDIEPLDGASQAADRRGMAVIARQSDLILCHTHASSQEIIRRYRPQCQVIIMPHGNYDGVYPPPRPRAQVLAELALDPSRPVVSCLGRIRQYKGLDLACEAVGRCKGVQLLIAGTVQRGFDIEELRRCVVRSKRIRLLDRHMTDQEFSDYAAASDAILLPYRKITGSGALLAAWTLGRGVVASDLDLFREMVPEESQAGRLFTRDDPAALAEAIREYLLVPVQMRNNAARRMADRYEWQQCVLPVAEALRGWHPQRMLGSERASGCLVERDTTAPQSA